MLWCFLFCFIVGLCCLGIVFFFFFSSRRRHTRCGRDWSSDVCSSDLIHLALLTLTGLFVVTVLAQVGENPCFFAFLFKALERTLKALVIVNDDFRHKPRFS